MRSDATSTAELYASLITSNPQLGQQLKPQFHIRPPMGWVNDPNGPLEYPKGTYHLFFQYNPAGSNWVCCWMGNVSAWCTHGFHGYTCYTLVTLSILPRTLMLHHTQGAPYWAHVVSNDMVHWRTLPMALTPDTLYDYAGVFSGSATILFNNTPAILYTGRLRGGRLSHHRVPIPTPSPPTHPRCFSFRYAWLLLPGASPCHPCQPLRPRPHAMDQAANAHHGRCPPRGKSLPMA